MVRIRIKAVKRPGHHTVGVYHQLAAAGFTCRKARRQGRVVRVWERP